MKELLKKKTKEVEEIIFPLFNSFGGGSSVLSESMEYALKSGGKRLRPMLMKEACNLFMDSNESLPVFMAAIEVIHNYSLVHDDLPALDNDNLRHGVPSTHAKFGECEGILCGDGLLNYAYELVLGEIEKKPTTENIRAAKMLAECAGHNGMVGGQCVDVMYDKSEDRPSMEDLLYIYSNKTGKLIRASLAIGGILGRAKADDVKKLIKIGDNIGFAFQVVDDILDFIGDEKTLGKPIGSDKKNEKYTYVDAIGIDKAKKEIESLTDEAMELLMTLPGDKEFLKNLFIYLTKRDY